MKIEKKTSILYRAKVINKIFNGADFASIPYCILRNYSDLPNSTLGGDIDLIINSNSKERWENHLQFISSFYGLDLGIIQKHYHGTRYCIFNIKKSFFIMASRFYPSTSSNCHSLSPRSDLRAFFPSPLATKSEPLLLTYLFGLISMMT